MTSSVYLVFDAETGEFVEVDDSERQRQHQQDAEAIASGVEKPAVVAAASEEAASDRNPVAAALIVVALVFGGLAVAWRSRRHA